MRIARVCEGGVVIVELILAILGLQAGVERCAAFIQPGEGLTVVGVVLPLSTGISHGANQADLVTVVDGRRAGHGHLHGYSAFEALDGVTPVIVGVRVEGWVVRIGVVVEHE